MGTMDGRVAIVTGASRGIGAAIAKRFAAEGARVVLAARTLDASSGSSYPGTLAATLATIRDAGGEAVAIRADLSVPDDRPRLVEQAREAFGPIDVLVNNAAASWSLPWVEFPAKRFEVMHQVHVRSSFELAQLVVPDMQALGRGWILNLTSAAARHPVGPPYSEAEQRAGTLVYSMCKVALERFTTGLAAQLWEDGIAVNALGPSKGVVTHGMNSPPVDESRLDLTESADETAAAALVLCTCDHKVVTGHVTATADVLGADASGIPNTRDLEEHVR
jgi:citronellol/citronellal dehydrogenase